MILIRRPIRTAPVKKTGIVYVIDLKLNLNPPPFTFPSYFPFPLSPSPHTQHLVCQLRLDSKIRLLLQLTIGCCFVGLFSSGLCSDFDACLNFMYWSRGSSSLLIWRSVVSRCWDSKCLVAAVEAEVMS